jgi:hypothetical protein
MKAPHPRELPVLQHNTEKKNNANIYHKSTETPHSKTHSHGLISNVVALCLKNTLSVSLFEMLALN